jgi:hypothetical protein
MTKKIKAVRVNHADVAVQALIFVHGVCTATAAVAEGTIELLQAYSAWLDKRYDERAERARFMEDARVEIDMLSRSGS